MKIITPDFETGSIYNSFAVMIIQRIRRLITDYRFLLALYIVVTVVASIVQYAKPSGDSYTKYNNFIIFRQSFLHLVHGLDLYNNYLQEYFDLYKYSPGFAMLMAPFAWLPDLPGLILWNLLNALVLFYAVYFLPRLNKEHKAFILLFVLIELLTSIQNSQSNGLIAGLLVGSFVLLENRKVALASLLIVVSAYIKIFGIAAVVLALLYPEKIKFAGYTLLWIVVFAFLPLVFISWDSLMMQYRNWYHLISYDMNASSGISLYGIIQPWMNSLNKYLIFPVGFLILLAPFLFIARCKEYSFRILIFSSLMVWLVIFSQRAESPTYIIAVTGVAIWFFSKTKTLFDIVLILLVLLFTELSPSDLFPRSFRNEIIIPYSLKALPCVLVWIKINYELLLKRMPKTQLS